MGTFNFWVRHRDRQAAGKCLLQRRASRLPSLLALILGITSCARSSDQGLRVDEISVPTSYDFTSSFSDGTSVSYTGQIMRHVLVTELVAYIEGLTERIDVDAWIPKPGEVVAGLNYYYDFDSDASGADALSMTTTPVAKQTTYQQISTGKDIRGKIAGNDPNGQHQDWVAQGIVGWASTQVLSPDALLRSWFEQIEALAIDRANGQVAQDPQGQPIPKVYITADGLDLKQLIQKFISGALAYSQGTDDYLDDTIEGKGLLSDHSKAVDGKPYSELEHAWDEAFGYFGAARAYGSFTDEEIAGKGGRAAYSKGYHDENGDGQIDLASEYCFGHSVNAAKRDLASHESARTDFTNEAFGAFKLGRAIIAASDGALVPEFLDAVKAQRDKAVLAWEKTIAATVVHYINDVLADMLRAEADYSFVEHAKHWSEMKGFAMALQFNPRSQLNQEQFRSLHGYLGNAPIQPVASAAADYKAALRQAKDLLALAYGFSPLNMGDDSGEGGF